MGRPMFPEDTVQIGLRLPGEIDDQVEIDILAYALKIRL